MKSFFGIERVPTRIGSRLWSGNRGSMGNPVKRDRAEKLKAVRNRAEKRKAVRNRAEKRKAVRNRGERRKTVRYRRGRRQTGKQVRADLPDAVRQWRIAVNMW